MSRVVALLLAATLSLFVRASFAEAPREILHTVQKGQYLALIAKRYHTTPEAIRQHNNLKKGQTLQPGMKLRIVEVEEHRRWRKYYDEKQAGKTAKPKKGGRSGASSAPQTPSAVKGPVKGPSPPKGRAAKDATRAENPTKPGAAKELGPKTPAKPAPAPKPETVRPGNETNVASPDEFARDTTRPGFVILVRQDKSYRGQLVDAQGSVVARTAQRVDGLLRSRRTGASHEIDRRLLKLLAQVSDHFGSRTIIVVSGFRPYSERQYTKNSRHNHGKAIDFRVAGVPTDVLYDYCRGFRKVGCGYYPNSGFVHMDVREYKTQWTDYSKPGQAPVYAKKN